MGGSRSIHTGMSRLVKSSFQPELKRGLTATQSRSFLNMNFLSDIFYDIRSSQLGFASKEQVKAAASNPKAVFLDVRSQAEIAAACLKTDKPVLHTLEKLPPNKDVPIIVFCASGKRASSAKKVLEGKGYTNVLNAGGLGDLDYL
jgi:phage shock protein E